VSDDFIYIFPKMERDGVDWILLPQNRIQWEAVVNMAVNLRVL
jgi:hypothetical protein